MTTATAQASPATLTDEQGAASQNQEQGKSEKENARLRYAMLSVYYRSLGSQLESRGAPIAIVPPDVQPLSLEEALAILVKSGDERLLWDAYWRIVRSVPVEGSRRSLDRRYPKALVDRLGLEMLADLDVRRQESRAGAQIFAAALGACAHCRWAEAKALAKLLKKQSGQGLALGRLLGLGVGEFREAKDFNEHSEDALGQNACDFLAWLMKPERRAHTASELQHLQAQVGLNLHDFVEDFADAVAFQGFKNECGAPRTVLTSSCIVRQDTNTLTTTATVTTLVETTFQALTDVIDPLHWKRGSDVIRDTRYVHGPFDLTEVPLGKGPDPEGAGSDRYLLEDVGVHWGFDDTPTGAFSNVLIVRFEACEERGRINLPFRLSRSIDSRILWDARPGGILIDGGYIVARALGNGRWRVTTRKVLRFSDRTPYSNAAGWLDFGQLLNFLAPASVTWWLETDFYSAESMRQGANAAISDQDGGAEGDADER